MIRLMLLCGLACACAPAFAQEGRTLRDLSTDRPDKTESPFTVDAGRFQIEVDFVSFTRDRSDDVDTETLAVTPFNIKYGLDDRTDLQIVVEPYLRQSATDRATGSAARVDGIGDVTIRLKRNLWGNDDGATALAIMPFLRLPTSTNGLGAEAAEFGLIVPFAFDLAPGIGVGLMTELDFTREPGDEDYEPTFVNSATIAFDLTDRLGLYTELFTERSVRNGARWIVTGDVGLTYAVGANTQLDTGVNIGLSDAADDLNLFVGISRRF